jgi:hypothetical protein
MSHREKTLNSLYKHGKVIQVIKLEDIPKTNYVYAVVNGDNVLQIGKSGHRNKGRLKRVFKGSIPAKHNKAFICGLYPSIVDSDNEYYAIALNEDQDKSKIEGDIHHDMGITTNVRGATLIDDMTNVGIPEFHLFLWERFKEHPRYIQMDKIEKLMAHELYELVTFGSSLITRSSGKCPPITQGDNLEGNVLMCLDKLYLTTIWLKMCNNYFRYGKHSISNSEFEAVKEKYQYQEYGAKFDVFGESPSLRR